MLIVLIIDFFCLFREYFFDEIVVNTWRVFGYRILWFDSTLCHDTINNFCSEYKVMRCTSNSYHPKLCVFLKIFIGYSTSFSIKFTLAFSLFFILVLTIKPILFVEFAFNV
jgi:hypothetical protein